MSPVENVEEKLIASVQALVQGIPASEMVTGSELPQSTLDVQQKIAIIHQLAAVASSATVQSALLKVAMEISEADEVRMESVLILVRQDPYTTERILRSMLLESDPEFRIFAIEGLYANAQIDIDELELLLEGVATDEETEMIASLRAGTDLALYYFDRERGK